jgi:RNA polymerase sigma factor (sigma-70 family)
VFCTAAVQLPKLREPDKLRPWLYAIARNEALRCIRLRHRENVSEQLPEEPSSEAGPDTLAARCELADLIAEAAGGLSDRDRSVLELSYRHGLDGPELAEALGVSPGNAAKMVSRLRETIERSLGALLVARGAQRNPQGCPGLSVILADWDGRFSVLARKRIARHIDDCATCERSRRNLVNPRALLGAVPILVGAPWWLRGQTLTKVQLTSADFSLDAATNAVSVNTAADTGYHPATTTLGGPDADPDSGPDPDSQFHADDGAGRRTRGIKAVLVLIGILVVAAGVTVFWLHRHDTSVAPTVIKTTTAPTPANTPPPAQTAPSSLPPTETAPSSQPQASPPSNPVPSPTVAPSYAPTPVHTPTAKAPIPSPPVVSSVEAQPPPVTHAPGVPPMWVPPMLPLPAPAPWTPPQWTMPHWTPPQMTTPTYAPPVMTPSPVVPPSRRSGGLS